jgi:hypothetical protein
MADRATAGRSPALDGDAARGKHLLDMFSLRAIGGRLTKRNLKYAK